MSEYLEPDDDEAYRMHFGTDMLGAEVTAEPYAPLIVPVGMPRTGKTRHVAKGIAEGWPGSAVLATVRPDMLELTLTARCRRWPVAVLDPSHAPRDPTLRSRWNLLSLCRTLQGAIATAQHMTSTAMTAASLREGEYWYLMARLLLTTYLYAGAIAGKTMADVVRWAKEREEYVVRGILQGAGGDPGDRDDSWSDPAPDAFEDPYPWGRGPDDAENREQWATWPTTRHASRKRAREFGQDSEASQALRTADGIWGLDDRVRLSIYATLNGVLAGFDIPSVTETLGDGIDLEEFLDRPGATLYVIAPAVNQRVFAPIVTTVLGAALDAGVKKHERTNGAARLLVLLDEAGNIGMLPNAALHSSTSTGHGITLAHINYDVGQLVSLYKTESSTILGNSHVVLALPGVDPQAAAMIDSRVGAEPDPSLPRGTGVDRLRRVPLGHAICMIGRDDPILIRLLRGDAAIRDHGEAQIRMRCSPGRFARGYL